jgi:hypothetical protein
MLAPFAPAVAVLPLPGALAAKLESLDAVSLEQANPASSDPNITKTS